MSQIVEGYPGEPRVLKERPPGAVYKVVAANWGSSSGCKDPLCAFISLFVLLQGFLCHPGQRNGAVALGRFWGVALPAQIVLFTRSTPFAKSTSSHLRPSSSPCRSPVVTAST